MRLRVDGTSCHAAIIAWSEVASSGYGCTEPNASSELSFAASSAPPATGGALENSVYPRYVLDPARSGRAPREVARLHHVAVRAQIGDHLRRDLALVERASAPPRRLSGVREVGIPTVSPACSGLPSRRRARACRTENLASGGERRAALRSRRVAIASNADRRLERIGYTESSCCRISLREVHRGHGARRVRHGGARPSAGARSGATMCWWRLAPRTRVRLDEPRSRDLFADSIWPKLLGPLASGPRRRARTTRYSRVDPLPPRQHLESAAVARDARSTAARPVSLLVRGCSRSRSCNTDASSSSVRGDGARPVLRFERLPLCVPRRRVRRRVVQHGRAIPELIERVRVVHRAIGRGRSLLLDEPQIGRDRRGYRPHAPADRREKVRFAISGAIRIAIVADRGDRLRRRKIDERDRLSVRIPRGLGVPSACNVHVAAVERRNVDRATRAGRRPGESVAGRRPRRALDSRVGQHSAVLPVVHGEHVKFSRRGRDRDVSDARAIGRRRGPCLGCGILGEARLGDGGRRQRGGPSRPRRARCVVRRTVGSASAARRRESLGLLQCLVGAATRQDRTAGSIRQKTITRRQASAGSRSHARTRRDARCHAPDFEDDPDVAETLTARRQSRGGGVANAGGIRRQAGNLAAGRGEGSEHRLRPFHVDERMKPVAASSMRR